MRKILVTGATVSDGSGIVRTIVISDIRGYSTFTRELGDETAARLAKGFADLAREVVEARNGRVIGLRGDEAVAVFESPSQAIMYLSNAAQWPTDLGTCRRFACRVAGRDLTRTEWDDVLPNRPYQRVCPQ